MQFRFSSLRWNPTCSCEKPGDVVEATGGILSAWRPSSGVVVRGGRRWPLEQPQAFHNQRPQAIAATGFPQPCGRRSFPTQACHAATCHVQGSDRGPAGETAVVRSLVTGVGVKASAKKDEVSLPQTGTFLAGMKKAAEPLALLCLALLCYISGRWELLFCYSIMSPLCNWERSFLLVDVVMLLSFMKWTWRRFGPLAREGTGRHPRRRPWESRTRPRPCSVFLVAWS